MMTLRLYSRTLLVVSFLTSTLFTSAATVQVVTSPLATPRERFGAERLRAAVAGLNVPAGTRVVLGLRSSPKIEAYKALPELWPGASEAFVLKRIGNDWIVAGSDSSGVLYGALELASRVTQSHQLPRTIEYIDHPALKLRGTCIGMQKPEITYEGAQYDYPYTPKDFPFFYDKAEWTRYLDMLVRQRMNALFLWNGHPFTSLLKLPKYPEAQELPTAQLEQNIAMMQWITAEADKRGIWLLQGFYNLHLSHAFARAHNVPYHLVNPTPLSIEYTRYVVSEFIRNYPNVGLMMTLGEALSPHKGADLLTQAIIPGVKDGMKAMGTTVEPPIVVRAHATDIEDVMKAAKPLYGNIDTMFKWNGESLTWWDVRNSVRDRFSMLVANSNVATANVHLMSNLEPFRWGDPDFVRETLLNFQKIGISGLHLYPLRYWDWPNAADKTDLLLYQPERDWIWFDSWARYAWNPNRNPASEQNFWANEFAKRFGDQAAGEKLLEAYTLAGPAQPRLLPRIGITEGNRQVFALGMTMPQLIDARRYGPAETLWTGDAPAGERLDEYVEKEFTGKPHSGETPVAIADEMAERTAKAWETAKLTEPHITRNVEEYHRIVSDMECISLLMAYYKAKTHAAAEIMLFGYDKNAERLKRADTLLTDSVESFRKLTVITDKTYRNAAGMQTSQRQIPVRGGPRTNHWRDLLPVYEKELAVYRERLRAMSDPAAKNESKAAVRPLPQVGFTLESGIGEAFAIKSGEKLFTDNSLEITSVVPELEGFKGIRVSSKESKSVRFTLDKQAQVLVGFLRKGVNKAGPQNSDAENWNPVLTNAITVKDSPSLTVWAAPLSAGRNELELGRGTYVILGFVPQDTRIKARTNFSTASVNGAPPNLDWMFED
jgi:hypothetical protein